MDNETTQKLNREGFQELYEELHRTHKPMKMMYGNEYLAELGRIVIRFARLEWTMKGHIGLFIGAPKETSQIITAELSFKNVVIMINNVHNAIFGPSDNWDLIVKSVYDVEVVRNQLMHSYWLSGTDEIVRLKIDAKKGVRHKVEHYSLDDLKAIYEWIDKVDTAVDAYFFRKMDEARGIE